MSAEPRYRITERVDQGGMAEVFKGVAESLQGFKKNVAIKRILPNLTKNKKFVSMFLDEARLSLHLQHANIVHVFDIGVADSTYFIVMEFVDGCNLKAILEWHKKKGKTLALGSLLYVMLEVCKGLGYAHDMADPETNRPLGIVHRDISPPNILLSKTGEVKLVDFGLAKANSQLEDTDPGVVKGKFSYLSPEAASGQPVDARADLFAVGILMWEMLTNKRLFFGETDYQTVELVRQARIPSVSALNPEVEPELEAIVRKTLSRDADDRYASAGDLGDAIAQYLFSRGRKVTQRDIATMVRTVMDDKAKTSGTMKRPSLIDALISDEIVKFTSLDMGAEDLAAAAAQAVADKASGTAPKPPSAEASQPLDPSSFVDPREWSEDTGSQQPTTMKSRRGQAAAVAPSRDKKPPLSPNDSRGPAVNGKSGAGKTARGSGHVPKQIEPEKSRPSRANKIEDLGSLLEPDKTGTQTKSAPDSDGKGTIIALVALIVLGGAAAAAHFVLHLF